MYSDALQHRTHGIVCMPRIDSNFVADLRAQKGNETKQNVPNLIMTNIIDLRMWRVSAVAIATNCCLFAPSTLTHVVANCTFTARSSRLYAHMLICAHGIQCRLDVPNYLRSFTPRLHTYLLRLIGVSRCQVCACVATTVNLIPSTMTDI